jgi:hypothetical protein
VVVAPVLPGVAPPGEPPLSAGVAGRKLVGAALLGALLIERRPPSTLAAAPGSVG